MTESKEDRMNRFSRILFASRKKAHKSQEYMAEQLDVARKTIQNWEKGTSSPSLFQGIEWFRVLGMNPLPYLLKYEYPSQMAVTGLNDSDAKIDVAFNHMIKELSITEKRILLYLFYGDHGGSPSLMLQLLLAYFHTPLRSRVTSAYVILANYKLEKEMDNILCPGNILPNEKMLEEGIITAQQAVSKNETWYWDANKGL